MFKTIVTIVLACTALAGGARQAFAAEDLVTAKRIGRAAAPKTLSLYVTGDGGPWSPLSQLANAYAKIYLDFIGAYPDWKIVPQIQSGDIAQVHMKLLEQAKSGKAPDCSSIDTSTLPLFMKAGVLADLTPYFSAEQVADLFPYAREAVTDKDGKIRAWWFATDLRVLYRNTEIIPEAPETWDEMKAAALAAKEKGFEGILFNGGRYEGTTFDWLSNFWVQGGRLVDEDGAPIFAQGENRAKMLKALNYYKDLVESGAAPKRVSAIINNDDLNVAAVAGTAASFVGGSWQWRQLQRTMAPEQLKKWTFSDLPSPIAGKHTTGVGGWSFASFSKDPEKVRMCAALIKDVYMGRGNAAEGVLPTSKGLYDAFPAFSTPENKMFAKILESGHTRPGVPIYPEISNQIQIMIGTILSGKSSPEAALDAADKAVQSAYKRMK